jgi:two-component system sensor histidine kinase DevS
MHDLRSAVDGIAPERAVEQGLRADLMEVLVDEHAALMLTPDVRFGGEFDEIGSELRHQILAIFREVLSNVARHAHASFVDIVVETIDDLLLLRVRDDGVGFDPAEPRSGRGLRNLTQRARLLGGTFTVRSNHGEGTVVECLVPLGGSDR